VVTVTAYDPLHGPDDVTTAPASLEVELAVTKRILDETAGLNIHDGDDMRQAAFALNARVRALVAAVEAERGGRS
jgi:hypothetical protein